MVIERSKNMNIKSVLLVVIVMCNCWNSVSAQSQIRINQLGYYPMSEKIAVIESSSVLSFEIVDAATGEVVYNGVSTVPRVWTHSGESVVQADFSDLKTEGRFTLRIAGDESYEFEIRNRINHDLAKASIKAFYFNRASTSLLSEHAGKWARPAGHPDNRVFIHSSAASPERPQGTQISAPKGWYDAGDYNKYIVNSGISTYTLLAAYEHFPEFYNNLDINIPESGNGIPDLLNEIRWNLDWMLDMQDPNDGGVYTKLTTQNFSGAVMPHQAVAPRYVVLKSTSAALNFTAVMSTAARVYAPFDKDFAQRCLDAALDAWQWAKANPAIYFRNPTGINTGEYGDGNVSDEFDWAAAELYITTKNDSYWNERNFPSMGVGIPAWPYVRPLAWVSLGHHRHDLTPVASISMIESKLINQANTLRSHYRVSPYRVSKGHANSDFVWGSNGGAANHGLMLLQAYRITGDESYLDATMAILDYLLGRNATGYSFITGFGSKPPMFPHHRVSEADNIVDPVPGFVVGGPHSGQQDGCTYPSNLRAKSYLDHWCSYSTNEVAINWNAPLVYLVGAIEYFKMDSTGTSLLLEDDRPNRHQLYQNYPNPFNPSTTISYKMADYSMANLSVFDMMGRQIAVLVDGYLSAGDHKVGFDATGLASGIYMYRLSTQNSSYTRKFLVLK